MLEPEKPDINRQYNKKKAYIAVVFIQILICVLMNLTFLLVPESKRNGSPL